MSKYSDERFEEFQSSDGWPHPVVSKSKREAPLTTNPRGNRKCHICGRKVVINEGFTCSVCLGKLVAKVKRSQSLFEEVEGEVDLPEHRTLKEIVMDVMKGL